MSEAILADAHQREDLFHWLGPIEPGGLKSWLAHQQLEVPDDLFALWTATGGGDMFESETILAPFGDPTLADDVTSVNEFHRRRGMSPAYLLFHVGLGLTAIRLADGRIVELAPDTYQEKQEFPSLASWYDSIRSELAARYGLE